MFGVNKKVRWFFYSMLVLCCCCFLFSCGDPIGGSGKSPVFITVELDEPWGIFSDVYDASYNGNATMDTIFVDLNSRYRDPSGATETDFADVLINMMTVTYFRYDGSTDVPEPFTYYIQNGNVPAGGVLNLEIPVVLQKAKWESPLEELAFGGGEGTISMQAQVDFYGADVAGNSVHCNVTLNINASDY